MTKSIGSFLAGGAADCALDDSASDGLASADDFAAADAAADDALDAAAAEDAADRAAAADEADAAVAARPAALWAREFVTATRITNIAAMSAATMNTVRQRGPLGGAGGAASGGGGAGAGGGGGGKSAMR
jgi:hypothetical protein